MEIQLTFCELRRKDVINIVDGRKLGRIIDMVFNIKGHIEGFITPGIKRWGIFKSTDNIFIPWCDIKKIGEDVIIVELRPGSSRRPKHHDNDVCCCDDPCPPDFCKSDVHNQNPDIRYANKSNNDYQNNYSQSNNQSNSSQHETNRNNYSSYHNANTTNSQDIDYFMKYYHND